MRKEEETRIRLPKTVRLHSEFKDGEFVITSGDNRKRKHIVTIEAGKDTLRTLAALILSQTEEIEDE